MEELSLNEMLIYVGGLIIKTTDPNQWFVILPQEQAESKPLSTIRAEILS